MLSEDNRRQMLRALNAIKTGKWSRAESLIAGTRDPLARKIYDWMAYTRGHGEPSFAQLSVFVRENPDWPRRGRLRLLAEQALLDERRDDTDLTAWFDKHPPLTPEGMEAYLGALQRRDNTAILTETARSWWADTLLTPDQQARFLRAYGRYLDTDTHITRFNNLLFNNHFTNARAVARLLGRGYPALAEARIALANNSRGVDGKIAAVPPHLAKDPGLLYERLHWRRVKKRNVAAIEILHNPPPAQHIPNLADWWRERHIIARRLIEEKQFESAYLLVAAHQQEEGLPFAQAEFLAGWLALEIGKPWRAFEHFEALYHRVSTPISRARGAYWAGRASEDLGFPDIARQWYMAAARHQTAYYGQVALGKLDAHYRPPQLAPPTRSLEAVNRFNRLEMVQASRLLNRAGLRKETTDFLDALAAQIETADEYVLLADLAEDMDHYHNAVRIAKAGLRKDIFMMEHAFPTILSRLKYVEQEWALVHALIRQESAFNYTAQSHAGARGLMQLMPATAREVAKKNGWAHRTDWLTSRPNHNIRLGAAYWQEMLDRYDGSYPLALAAYNGGPGRVDRWLKTYGDPRTAEISIIDWVELIPIYETRNYVQRVLESLYVYRIKLRDVQKSADTPIHVAFRE